MWIFIFTAKKKKNKVKQVKDKTRTELPPASWLHLCSTAHHSCRGHQVVLGRNRKGKLKRKTECQADRGKEHQAPQMEESRRGRKEKSGRLEWKRLSELPDSPGTTLGGMLINYLTILQPRKFFLWSCPFVSQEKGAVGVEEEKERGCGLSSGYSPGWWGGGSL